MSTWSRSTRPVHSPSAPPRVAAIKPREQPVSQAVTAVGRSHGRAERTHRALGPLGALEQPVREVRAAAQLRDRHLQSAGAGCPAPGPGLWRWRCFRPDALSLVLDGRGAVTTTLEGVSPKKKPEPSAEEQAAQELVRLAREQGLSLTGPEGLLKQFTKSVLERATVRP